MATTPRSREQRLRLNHIREAQWEFGLDRPCAIPDATPVQRTRKTIRQAKMILGVSPLEARVDEIERRLESSQITVPIQTLVPSQLVLVKPIWAVLQPDEEAYLISFFDANINATGDSEVDAIESLKQRIVQTFSHFSANEDRLGKEPARQLAVLRQFIRRE